MRPSIAGVVFMGCVGLAGCGNGGAGVASLSGSSAHTSPSPDASAIAAYQAVVLCARQHGIPNLPDVKVDDHGQPSFPDIPGGATQPPQSVLDGCKDLIARLPAKVSQGSRPNLSAADLARTRKFAACLRTQGYPNFPDPQPDGTFTSNGPSGSPGALPAKNSPAWANCRHYLPIR